MTGAPIPIVRKTTVTGTPSELGSGLFRDFRADSVPNRAIGSHSAPMKTASGR